ncbi:MAG: porin [Pedobacter sp.]|nr:MAG: porin [Pedobacter sp.]
MKATFLLALGLCLLSVTARAQEKKWYETFNIRGYAQVRYNRLLETNPNLGCEQCDASWGDKGSFFLRRVRLIFSGQISKRAYFYIQPDFASSASGGLNYGQLRDAYFDIGIDDKNEFRVRIGQSKIPYGFENMQSSQNRLPLDRSDAINSALRNERDAGVFFYWAPTSTRELFADLIDQGLKGSGDYGVFAFGAYTGQTANNPELNNQPHIVTRLSYPFRIGKQIIEPGIQAYTGKFVMPENRVSEGIGLAENREYIDQRAAVSFVLYPQPFGIQAEYNVGKGPQFDRSTNSISTHNLKGGYVLLSYQQKLGSQVVMPFSRYQRYKGGKKHELDARSYDVEELELGLEWQPFKQFELVGMYTISSRRYEDFQLPNNLQQGNLLRLQAQLNF